MANSNVSFRVEGTSLLDGGAKLIHGWVAVGYPDEYDTTNTWFDLSNHLKSGGSPGVIIMSQSGYRLKYNPATAAGGTVTAYFIDNQNTNKAANGAQTPCENALNIATNALFIAIGPAY